MKRRNELTMLGAGALWVASTLYPARGVPAEEAARPNAPFASKCLRWFPAAGNPLLVNISNQCGYCVVAATHWEFNDGRTLEKNLNVKSQAQITISVGGTQRVFQVGERSC